MRSARRQVLERLKIYALSHGVSVDDEVLTQLGGASSLTIHEYATTGGITLELEDRVYANAPFDNDRSRESPLRLTSSNGRLTLVLGDMEARVEHVLPLPGYLAVQDPEGRPVRATTMSHADRIRVSPIVGCAYDCAFCDLADLRYERRPVEQIIQGIDVAHSDETLPPRHLLISGGSPGSAAGHQRYFEEACVRIAEHTRALPAATGYDSFDVDVMMSAVPDGPDLVNRLVDAGVSGFSLNIELFSDDAATRHLPRKHDKARPHLEAMIRQAVERLGSGTGAVRSLIIVGLEPPEDTLDGVDWLASLGADPVLSPFRPAEGTQLRDREPPTPQVLGDVLHAARDIAASHDVALGPRCVPCQHNTLTFPWDVPRSVGAHT